MVTEEKVPEASEEEKSTQASVPPSTEKKSEDNKKSLKSKKSKKKDGAPTKGRLSLRPKKRKDDSDEENVSSRKTERRSTLATPSDHSQNENSENTTPTKAESSSQNNNNNTNNTLNNNLKDQFTSLLKRFSPKKSSDQETTTPRERKEEAVSLPITQIEKPTTTVTPTGQDQSPTNPPDNSSSLPTTTQTEKPSGSRSRSASEAENTQNKNPTTAENSVHFKVDETQDDETKQPKLKNSGSVNRGGRTVKKKETPKIERIEIPRLNGMERFVSYFFVVGAGKELAPIEPRDTIKDPLSRAFKGSLLELFPSSNKEDPFPDHMWMFCMPRGLMLKLENPGPCCFPFVLTSAVGARLYGCCLTFYEPLSAELAKSISIPDTLQQNVYAPKCICVLSHWPFYSAYRDWLAEMYRQVFVAQTKFTVPLEFYIINFVMEIPLPPAQHCKVQFKVGDKTLAITRPSPEAFPLADLPFHYLFKCLSLTNVLALFTCVMIEQKVILYSQHSTLLTYICEAIQLLLYPFQWYHVYVPILPEVLKDFVYSPTPYIMGVYRDLVPSVFEYVKQDVVLIDLDNNTVHSPAPIPSLPEPQTSQLVLELKQLLFRDILTIDQPSFNPYNIANNSTNAVENSWKYTNHYIQCVFFKFFATVFHDYRNYLMYIRVFRKTVAMFDTARFLAARKESKEFFECFMETQAFSLFLEEYNKPTTKIFDQWIDQKTYKLKIEEILNLNDVHTLFKEKFKEVVEVPDPRIPASFSGKIPEPTVGPFPTFPSLNTEIMTQGEYTKPIKVNVIPSTPDQKKKRKNVQDPNNNNTGTDTSTVNAAREKLLGVPHSERDVKLVTELISKYLENCRQKQITESTDFNQLLDLLKFDYGRQQFAESLIADKETLEKEGVTCLTHECYDQLVELIELALREANGSKDLDTPRLLMTAVFTYFRIENGAEDFLYQSRIKKLDVWQNHNFWEKAFFDSISKLCQTLYGNVRNKMEEFPQLPQKEQDSFVTAENDAVFRLLSKFAFNMVNLGVANDTVRRFMYKMCGVTALDDEQTRVLLQLLANLTRANEMLDASFAARDQSSPAINIRFKKGDMYVPVGLSKARGEESESEGKRLFHDFIEEKDESKVTMRKVRKQIKTQWLMHTGSKIKKVENSATEYRDDYTVKTFKGHNEGVLCVAISANGLVSGSCDGTIKLWDSLTGQCIHTMADHTGWVNLVNFYEDGKLASGSYDSTVKLWDLVKGHKIRTLRGHKASISSMKVKDKLILSASNDGTANLWDLRHKKPAMTFFGHTAAIMCLDADNDRVLTGSRDTSLRVWDLRGGKCIKTLEGHSDWVKCCKLEGDFAISGSCDSTMKIWNLADNSAPQTLEGHSGTVNHIWSDTKSIISASQDSTIKLWDWSIAACFKTLEGHTDEVLMCLPFQTKIVSCSYDNTVKVWDTDKGTSVCNLIGHTYRISSISVFENRILSGSWDKTVRLWEFPIDFRS